MWVFLCGFGHDYGFVLVKYLMLSLCGEICVWKAYLTRERERGINYNIHINSNCVNNCNYGSFCTSLYEPNFLLMLLYCD